MDHNHRQRPNFIVLSACSEPDQQISSVIPYPALSLVQVAQSTERAIETIGSLERYGMIRLAEELERQATLITQKGGISLSQKMHLLLLMSACTTELRTVSSQLNNQISKMLEH